MMVALVVGSAAGVRDDVQGAADMPYTAGSAIIAVNEAGLHLTDFDHWASLHPECFWRNNGDPKQGWVQRRMSKYGTHELLGPVHPYTLWGPSSKPTNFVTPLETQGKGSSGYFGVEVAKHLGADRIILCGIPMTETPHFDSDEPWEMANAHFKHWLREYKKGKLSGVRSMSGRTRDLLGAPTKEWLRGPAVTTG